MDKSIEHKRLENLNTIKMVLMLTVVLCHSVSFWCGGWFTAFEPEKVIKPLSIISGWTGSFHVYGFTLVSGYLFYYLKIECKKYESYKLFLLNKIKRLIVPYAVISIIWVIPITQIYYHYSIQELLNKFLLGISPSQLWFLWMLFWAYVLFWPIAQIVDKRPLIGCIFSLVLYGIGGVGDRIFPNLFNLLTGFQYVAFFFVGFIIRKYEKKLDKWNSIIPAICICAMHIILYSLKWHYQFSKNFAFVLDFITHMCGAVGAFLLLQYIFSKCDKVAEVCRERFKLLILYSMPIYLFHQQVIYVIISLLCNKINPYLHAALGFLVSISTSLAISILLSKFRIGREIIGEKEKQK